LSRDEEAGCSLFQKTKQFANKQEEEEAFKRKLLKDWKTVAQFLTARMILSIPRSLDATTPLELFSGRGDNRAIAQRNMHIVALP
jgi:hypothetical protein